MCMYNRFTLLHTWNSHNIANQLYSKKKGKYTDAPMGISPGVGEGEVHRPSSNNHTWVSSYHSGLSAVGEGLCVALWRWVMAQAGERRWPCHHHLQLRTSPASLQKLWVLTPLLLGSPSAVHLAAPLTAGSPSLSGSSVTPGHTVAPYYLPLSQH